MVQIRIAAIEMDRDKAPEASTLRTCNLQQIAVCNPLLTKDLVPEALTVHRGTASKSR